MTNLLLVFICLCLGLLFQRSKNFPDNAANILNNYVIYVALPALILKEIPALDLDSKALLPIIMSWLVMIFATGLVLLCARVFAWSRNMLGAMLLVCVLGNTSFVGIPLLEAHLGPEAIPYGILYDQLGTFIALNTFGIAVATLCSGTNNKINLALFTKILRFPPFIALLAAFALRLLPYPGWINDVLTRLAGTLVPVVMVAVGLQWQLKPERNQLLPLSLALSIILLLKPAFALTVLTLTGTEGFVALVVVLEAAMPAMISAGALAVSHNLAPRLSASIVGYSLLFSLGSVWLWKLIAI